MQIKLLASGILSWTPIFMKLTDMPNLFSKDDYIALLTNELNTYILKRYNYVFK